MTAERPKWITDMLAALTPFSSDNVDAELAVQIKSEHIPKRLYRYRACNEFSWNDLRDNTVWMSAGKYYNDPFDSGFAVFMETIETSSDRLFIRNLEHPLLDDATRQRLVQDSEPLISFLKLIAANGGVPEAESDKRIGQFMSAFKNVSQSHRLDVSAALQEIIHICSFSEQSASMLMWSHYSDQHRGFCVEYDFSALPAGDSRRGSLYPVIYEIDRFDGSPYIVESMGNRDKFNFLFGMVASLHKSPEWAYEKEWRLLFPFAGPTKGTVRQMPTPSHVYLGARISPEDEAKAIAICDEKRIPISRMRLSRTKYLLEPAPLSSASAG